MSSSKSWLPASKSRVLSNSSHELPRWRNPSPSASMIPPPIVQSRYMPPAQHQPVESVLIEKPTEFEDRQHELEADLQFLLDAQAEGLIRGLEGGSVDDRSSTGSTTPTVQSVRSPAPRRTRRPPRRLPGLRSARKGIYNSIIALANLKNEELRDVDSEVHEHDATLEQIEAWEKKREGLQEASRNVDSEEETIRVQRLKQEADALQVEINRVELSLTEMKSRHRKLMKQAAAVENSVQARLASYTESLRLLENDVQKFLRVSPEGVDSRPLAASSADVKASIWQLPPQRRNLDLAKEYWAEQREQAQQRQKETELEKAALVEGAGLWRDAVAEVTDFEKQLKAEMSALRPSSPSSQSAWEDPSASTTATEHADRMQSVLEKIDSVAESLHTKLQKAEQRSWRLLQAALGAELDALSRGKQILSSALTAAASSEETNGHSELKKTDSSEEIDALDKSFSTTRAVENDDDEEPPPELLFSQAHDLDNE